MGILKEEIYEINFYSPPLKKHLYAMRSIEKKAYVSSGEGSGLLFEEIHRREKIVEESGLLKNDSIPHDYNTLVVGEEDGEASSVKEAPPQKKKFRTLKKLEDLLYDDSLVKMGELEDEAYEMLNADGYYDEILPIDADVEYEPEDPRPIKAILILLVLLLGFLGIGYWYITHVL